MISDNDAVFTDNNRYMPRASHKADANEPVHNSTSELYPNVIRIEPLGFHARQAYLGAVHRTVDALKYRIAEQLNSEPFKPFYGIMSPDDLTNLTIGLTNAWSEQTAEQNITSAFNALGSPAVLMPLGANIGESATGNANGFTGGAAVGGAISAINAFTQNQKTGVIGKLHSGMGMIGSALSPGSSKNPTTGSEGAGILSLYGLDSSSTGSSTMKGFNGSKFDFKRSITIQWYLPEQEDLFRLSLHRLLQIGYVRDLYRDKSSTLGKRLAKATSSAAMQSFDSLGDMTAELGALADSAKASAKSIGELKNTALSGNDISAVDTAAGMTSSIAGNIQGTLGSWANDVLTPLSNKITQNQAEAKNGKFSNNQKNKVITATSDTVSKLLDTFFAAQDFFGYNVTLVPQPVRLTVGNILDIEPLVISDITISSSKELFVNRLGAHIPITVSAKIGFETWLTPGPNHDFIRFIGDNIFYPLRGS